MKERMEKMVETINHAAQQKLLKATGLKKFTKFLKTIGYTYEFVGDLQPVDDTERSSSEGSLLPRTLPFTMYPADMQIFNAKGKPVAYVKMAFRAGYDYKKGKEEGTLPYYEFIELQEAAKLSAQSINNTKLQLEFVYFYDGNYGKSIEDMPYVTEQYGYYKYARGKTKRLATRGYALTFNAAQEKLVNDPTRVFA